MKKKIFLIILILIIVFIVITYFHKQKMPETNQINNSNTTSENIIKNVISENQITFNNIIPSEIINNSTESIQYEFTSADNLAAQGDPGILKIFDLTNTKIDFEYNHGWNFAESTIDRKISGIATINDNNLYEFIENIDGHQYSITFKFSDEMVTLSEYIDGELFSMINLWA